jgi:hypothetical protein
MSYALRYYTLHLPLRPYALRPSVLLRPTPYTYTYALRPTPSLRYALNLTTPLQRYVLHLSTPYANMSFSTLRLHVLHAKMSFMLTCPSC